MLFTLPISEVFFERTSYGTCITFAASGNDENRKYLTIQNSNCFDAQDISLGMNYAYIEFCDQKNSQYGDINEIHFLDGTLSISFEKHSTICKETDIHIIKLGIEGSQCNLDLAIAELKEISIRDNIKNNL